LEGDNRLQKSLPKEQRKEEQRIMASVHIKTGGSGKDSPYWNGKFRGPNGSGWTLSTKLREKRTALRLARIWEQACEVAYNGHMTHERAQKVLAECAEVSRGRAYEKSQELVDECLRQSTGTGLNVQTPAKYFHDWLEAKAALGRTAPSTLRRYRPVLERFVAFLPEIRQRAPLAQVTATDVEAFMHSEKKRGLSNGTANTAVQVLGIVFNHAWRKSIIGRNPVLAVDLLEPDPDKRSPFTVEQVRSLLQVADVEMRGLILLGFYCGMRIGDAGRLRWGNVDLENRLVIFQAEKTARRKRGADKNTVVDLHPYLMNYLGALPMGEPSEPLFPTLSQLQVGGGGGLSGRFRQLMDRAGILSPLGAPKGQAGRVFRGLSYHSLRHSFVTALAAASVPIEVRRALAGHSSDAMSLGYTVASRTLTQAAIAALPSVAA
jgi:integrase